MTTENKISLAQIWADSSAALQIDLRANGHDLSDNINKDRALVAIYYHKKHILQDTEWIEHPNFVNVMAEAKTLEEGLCQLRRPFLIPLFTLVGYAALLKYATTATIWKRIEPASIIGIAIDIDDIYPVNLFSAIEPYKPIVYNYHHISDKKIAEAGYNKFAAVKKEISEAIAKLPIGSKSFDPVGIMKDLLSSNLSDMVPIAQHCYIDTMKELLQVIPPNPDLSTQLEKMISSICIKTTLPLPEEH